MYQLSALCALGTEKVLSNELKKLSLRVLESGYGRVRFKADIRGIWMALLSLRSADRVFLEVSSFEAKDFGALFDATAAIRWQDYIPESHSVLIDKVRTRQSLLKAETSIQSVCHKAIAQVLCQDRGLERLSQWQDSCTIRVYIEKDTVCLLLDLCGQPLFKRNWRSEAGTAPLRETLAASILLHSMWRRKIPLYDPFCGSGTFIVEAALYAWDYAPGLGRAFTLSSLPFTDSTIEDELRQALRKKINFSNTIRIAGSDKDIRSITIARANLRRAYELASGKLPSPGIKADDALPANLPSPLENFYPSFKDLDILSVHRSWDEGLLVANPPWGQRMGEEQEAEALYQNMSILKERFPQWKLVILTAHPGFESHFGWAAQRILEIGSGSIPSYLYTYEGVSRHGNRS